MAEKNMYQASLPIAFQFCLFKKRERVCTMAGGAFNNYYFIDNNYCKASQTFVLKNAVKTLNARFSKDLVHLLSALLMSLSRPQSNFLTATTDIFCLLTADLDPMSSQAQRPFSVFSSRSRSNFLTGTTDILCLLSADLDPISSQETSANFCLLQQINGGMSDDELVKLVPLRLNDGGKARLLISK